MDLDAATSVVFETLQRASSQNSEILKPAEQKLKEWETQPGFYSILLNVISNHNLDLNVRWLAVLFFKNGVDRYWRKTAPNAIQEEEKAHLRLGLMKTFSEPVNQVAIQLAVLISKAARFDCPREWPEFIPSLLTLVGSDQVLVQHRGLLTLHHVIKMLSSKRLAGDRKQFQELSSNIFSFVLSVWNLHVDNFYKEIQAGNLQCQSSLEKALLTLKVLRKLTVYGFITPESSPEVVTFVNQVLHQAKTMLNCRKSLLENQVSPSLIELIEKFIIHLTKVHISLLEIRPFSYISFIRSSLEFSVDYVFTSSGDGLLFERFIIQCLNLIKSLLLCAEYKVSRFADAGTPSISTSEAHRIRNEFFQVETLCDICRKLVTHYFLMTEDDLLMWDADPEGFASEEVGESWKYNLRPCTEAVFLAFFRVFHDTLSPVLLELVKNNVVIVDPNDIDAILRKDAVYNAAGLAAFNLFDEVDFDQWFLTTLTQELKIKAPNYRVIRRRVAWLIRQWAPVNFSPELMPVLYEALMPLLQSDEDMAIRLTAASALKCAIDDISFSTEQFMMYLERYWVLLYSLLKECKECDSKMQVLYVCSLIIERIGSAIAPYAATLIQYLPLLWEESGDHNMLRCAIVSTLVPFAKSGVNEIFSTFLIPVIQYSTDVGQDAHVYLLDDGLELWLAAVENSSTTFPGLMLLYNNMPALLNYSTEHLTLCLKIVKAYILLEPHQFLTEYGPVTFTTCCDMLTDLNADGKVLIMKMIETSIRARPTLAVPLLVPYLPALFNQVCNYKEVRHKVSVMNLVVISRILLFSQDVFCQALSLAASNVNESLELHFSKFLQSWIDVIVSVAGAELRKLLALALTSLLTSQSNVVVDKFCGILLMVTEVLNDITNTDDMGMQTDSLMLNEQSSQNTTNQDDYEKEEIDSDHDRRKCELYKTDPVVNIVLKDYLQSQINLMKQQLGENNYIQMIDTVDVETLNQARSYVAV